MIYNNVHELEVHEQSTLELDKVEIMKSDRKLQIRHRNIEWEARHPVINAVEMLNWAHSNKDDSDDTITVSGDNKERKESETEVKTRDLILKVDSNSSEARINKNKLGLSCAKLS